LTQGCGVTAALLAQPLLVSLEPGQAKAVQRQRCPIRLYEMARELPRLRCRGFF
jgi:hypothetical protein